jgi:hypothetical protein
MPTLAVGMIDFPEKHGMATTLWPWHHQIFKLSATVTKLEMFSARKGAMPGVI